MNECSAEGTATSPCSLVPSSLPISPEAPLSALLCSRGGGPPAAFCPGDWLLGSQKERGERGRALRQWNFHLQPWPGGHSARLQLSQGPRDTISSWAPSSQG